jgi:threonine dehydrogenase-like Zn-dependent dehydrogenase
VQHVDHAHDQLCICLLVSNLTLQQCCKEHRLCSYIAADGLSWPLPAADVNLLKVPEGKRDEVYIFLSDILPTAWHANELGQVGEGDRVAIWGAGPGACW